MDIKQKLEHHKKERDVRKRGVSVEDAWRRLDKDGNLSVKDKLEKLINLTGAAKSAGPKAARVIEEEPQPREAIQYFENSYGLDVRYGRLRVGDGLSIDGETLFYLSRDEEFQGLDLSTALFLDLETTGLAGGTGTIPFLVGLGYYRGDKFVVAQYFLGDPGGEEQMLEELARFFEEGKFRSVVTYNGKAFDVPLLETRFILKRRKFVMNDWPHLDFLFPARSLWKHQHESCRLFHLAREVVAADRSEDIPGAEIPQRYFDFLRSGEFGLIEPILYHNQEDILSLLGLVAAGAKLFKGERGKGEDEKGLAAMDLVGVGRIFETAGELDRSVAIFERALGGSLPAGIEVVLKEKISFHFKRAKNYEKAVPLWKDLSEQEWTVLNEREIKGILNGLRQLAIHNERHTRDLAEAVRVSEEGLALSQRIGGGRLAEDFRTRLERLNAKLLKAK
jgi:uncharacterized protein